MNDNKALRDRVEAAEAALEAVREEAAKTKMYLDFSTQEKTLRDEFAMSIAPTIYDREPGGSTFSALADKAYKFADYMLEARKK